MPEKPISNTIENTTPVQREITQTDKLNKRLLYSCLQYINSDKSNSLFTQQSRDNDIKKESEHEFEQNISTLHNSLELIQIKSTMQEDIFSEELVDMPNDIDQVIEDGAEVAQDGSGKESGNEDTKNEDEKEKVKIKRKLGPRPTLNAQRLKGPRGLGIMESFFSDIHLQGKGKEKEDLDVIMGRLEHWTHRLFPRMQFDDALKKIEKLGSKKEVSNYVKRIRLGMEDVESSETVPEDEPPNSPTPEDTFDQLMASTVVPSQPASMEMTEEQRERMLQNRLLAEERRNAHIKRAQELREQFLLKQALNQSSQNAETSSSEANKENEVQTSNTQEVQMDIDSGSVRTSRDEIGKEINDNQYTSSKIDEKKTSNSVQEDSIEITEEKREIILQNRLQAEEIRNARIKRAQELKEKFLENQALSQSSQTEESPKEINQENEMQRNSQREIDMEIDQNLDPIINSEVDGNITNIEKV